METWTIENEPKLFKMLIDAGADVNVQRNTDGMTPLLIAIKELTVRGEYRNVLIDGTKEIIDIFLDTNADVNVRDSEGHFPDYFIPENSSVYKKLCHVEQVTYATEEANSREFDAKNAFARGDFDLALASLNQALEFRKKIADKTEIFYARRNIANVYFSLGNVFADIKNNSEAKKYFNEALKIYESLLDKNNLLIRRDIAQVYEKLAGFEERKEENF